MPIGEGGVTNSSTPPAAVSQEKKPEKVTTTTDASTTADAPTPVPAENSLPEHVAYVLIGAGTASFACMKAIRERDPNAKVCQCLLHTRWVSILTPYMATSEKWYHPNKGKYNSRMHNNLM